MNIDNNSDVNKWANLLCDGKAVQYNEKTQTLERVGFFSRFCNFFRPKKARAIDQKVAEVVTKELRTRFEQHEAGANYDALINLSEALYSSKRIQKKAPEQVVVLERYLVGVKRAFSNENCHYAHQKNINFFDPNQYLYDPRLLNTSQNYAENNPDFVEFLLNNNIYYQMVRTCPEDEVTLQFDENGVPALPFAEFNADRTNQFERTWADTKEYLKDHELINLEDGTLKEHHMTRWGLVEQHSFMWDSLTPFTQIDPPAKPCFQIASYHPNESLVPGLSNDQGHTGMVFVGSDGRVFSCGFYSHPDSDFYVALKSQPSAIRSPDLYESRVDVSWQSIAADNEAMRPASLPTRWNDGILQFDFDDDAADAPCIEAVLKTWNEASDEIAEGVAKEGIQAKVTELTAALATNSRVADIERISGEAIQLLQAEGVHVNGMTADDKFKTLMGRVVDLQHKTKEALETGNWDNGALPYSLAENNCTHVSRYFFGQFAEVNLGARKTSQILNTRPSQKNKFLPPVEKSPISRLKWAQIAVKSVILGSVLRIGSILPIASKALGRGKAAPGFTPITSLKGCLKNFFKAPVSPQQVREESMAEQFNISSTTRKIINWFHKPSGLLPIYRR